MFIGFSAHKQGIGGTQRVSIILGPTTTANGEAGYKLRHVNDDVEYTVTPAEVKPIDPIPADVPSDMEDVDTKLLQRELSKEDLARI